ncbi:MAG: AAA domain-containing protein [Pirellulaceae bacterium]|nr:AAA domain-containing protein [Pirellulaceae bacterium]
MHLAIDENDEPFLVKLWPFEEHDELLFRRLWRAESNNLYRVSSSPGAEELLLVLRDSRVDKENKKFVMVLEAVGSGGYDTLAELLSERKKHDWLSSTERVTRRELWKAMLHLASGLDLLHRQQVIHRNLIPETVFLDRETGPESMRIGGFEWSLRLNYPAGNDPPNSWATPPEAFSSVDFGYRPETDWYAFGMLAARCFCSVESFDSEPVQDRHAKVVAEISRARGRLLPVETDLLLQLLALDPIDRISEFDVLEPAINEIVSALELGLGESVDSRPLVLAINPEQAADLVEQCTREGFQPDPDDASKDFQANLHANRLATFIQSDLKDPKVFPTSRKGNKLLVGEKCVYKIRQYQYFDETKGDYDYTWDIAYCYGVSDEFWGVDSMTKVKAIPVNGISVRTLRDVRKDRSLRQSCQSWDSGFLPDIDKGQKLRRVLNRFYEFVRATNQIELLIRDAELFTFERVSNTWIDKGTGTQRARIKITSRARPVFPEFALEGGAIEFLEKEKESGKRFASHVILTGEEIDGLHLPQEYLRIEPKDCWTVHSCDRSTQTIELSVDSQATSLPEPPERGYLRTFGMRGQIALIMRRKKAIERLANHTYLLRSLADPRVMDSGEEPLKHKLDAERDKVDESKQSIMKDILRIRPIYALQGPPGTGKTTLVAHLVRQILEDDPVAQILVTAQAHGAVDVLRTKVQKDAFADVAINDLPLSIRLGQESDEDEGALEGSAVFECRKIVTSALEQLLALESHSEVQNAWIDVLTSIESTARSSEKGNARLTELSELVKRGANLTYCTTSDKGLEQLAESERLFDWSILEESGKAHGFDLALPLQAGHRWILLGDQKQLPPYRFEDYRTGIDKLPKVVEWLELLPKDDRRFLDVEWVNLWSERDVDSQAEFMEYAKKTLNVFEKIFERCAWVHGSESITRDSSIGASAGQLTQQYRMHPAIGRLISDAYYDGELEHRTEDRLTGQPIEDIQHKLFLPESVGDIAGKAIVWIDMPWCQHDLRYGERGPDSIPSSPRFTNPEEADAIARFLELLSVKAEGSQEKDTIALLSPYNQQVRLLRRSNLPRFLEAKEASGRGRSEKSLAHSVDSFQGNEASVVIVSLVRNNDLLPGSGLGFLDKEYRINVLFSRAEKLLVLVGSWDFFQRQLRDVDLKSHKGKHELWHWKKVLSMLSAWFDDKDGPAVRIPVKSLRRSR